MKKATLFLKIASWLMILSGVIHSTGHFIDVPPSDESQKTLMDLMRNYHFTAAGFLNRTMEQIMLCFSWTFSLFSFSMGIFGLVLLKQHLELKVLRKLFLIIFIFVTLFVVINTRFAIVVPIVLYTTAWIFYLIGQFLLPKQ